MQAAENLLRSPREGIFGCNTKPMQIPWLILRSSADATNFNFSNREKFWKLNDESPRLSREVQRYCGFEGQGELKRNSRRLGIYFSHGSDVLRCGASLFWFNLAPCEIEDVGQRNSLMSTRQRSSVSPMFSSRCTNVNAVMTIPTIRFLDNDILSCN